eukprot:2784717-Pleurochrysis_carterae.AAC.1
MGHGKAFSAVYADGGIYGTSPTTRSDVSKSAATFNVLPVATIMETMNFMGLRAIFRDSTGRSRLLASLHYRSSRILIIGWTMSYKWAHPVATLPVTNGTIRHSCRLTEICESSPFPRARINYDGFRSQPPRAPTAPLQ